MNSLTEEELNKLKSLSDFEIFERIAFYVGYIRNFDERLCELKEEIEKPDIRKENYKILSDIEKEAMKMQIERIEEKRKLANEKAKGIVLFLASRLKEAIK